VEKKNKKKCVPLVPGVMPCACSGDILMSGGYFFFKYLLATRLPNITSGKSSSDDNH
jgi:hypothetical protein